MKPSTKRTLKKVFLNICAGLFALVFTGNIIAGENAGQINQVLGTKTSMTVSTAPAGTEEGYSRYFDSKYNSIAELKAAGEAKVREVEGEGIVLLKNEGGVLPLAAGSKVSLVGVTVMDPVYGGTGSGAVDANGAPNYLDVLTVYRERAEGPHRLSDAIAHYGTAGRNSHRALEDAQALMEVTRAMVAERDDLLSYVNLFGYREKYGVNGRRIEGVRYYPHFEGEKTE